MISLSEEELTIIRTFLDKVAGKTEVPKKKKRKESTKQHKCQFCEYKSSRISNVIVHQRTHTKEKPFKCKHCLYETSHKSNLMCHNIVIHDVRSS